MSYYKDDNSIILIFIFIFWIAITAVQSYIDKRKLEKLEKIKKYLLENKPTNRPVPKYEWWLTNIEPKYADSKTYGPDWTIRRKYIAEIYENNCALCHVKVPVEKGHVHHIETLESGKGTNSLYNLVLLCRSCHEEQHDHMKYWKKRRENEIQNRGTTEEQYFKEKKEETESRKRLEALFDRCIDYDKTRLPKHYEDVPF